jgi:hypothetical protein
VTSMADKASYSDLKAVYFNGNARARLGEG